MNKELTTVQTSTDIVPFNITKPPQEYLDDMRGVKVEYPQLKIPSGGGLFFEVDGEPKKELSVIIVYKRPMRVYYETSLDDAGDANNPPDCWSNNFDIGYKRLPYALPTEQQYEACNCSECEFAKWGSAGRGQACKEKTELFILLENNFLPMKFSLPVTSKVMFDQFLTKCMSKGQRYCSNLVKISLTKETTSGGKKIDYSRAKFEVIRPLTEYEMKQVTEMQDSVKAVIG